MHTCTTCVPSSGTRVAGSRRCVAWATGWQMVDPTAQIAPPSAIVDAAEEQASESDARLVRDVRWRLVAWSGGSTLLVLLILGIALYVSVASSLQASSLSALDNRASDVVAFIRGSPPTAADSPVDIIFG